MTSSIFYKFKNSRESERIIFHGTELSVFELKKEIINATGLGDGNFNLHIFPQDDPTSELKDDTTFIPRASTVIAIRRPAPRGQGRAARYVTGKAPSRAIISQAKSTPSLRGGHLDNSEDPEAAFLAESAMVWDAQKEALSHAKPVYRKNNIKNVVVPSHPPPPGYVCRRCNIKGHWIQACPTNDDPDFKPVFQAKRTTGIPQSFLKKVEKPVDEEAAKGIMLNADGEYVKVMTDQKTWDRYQEKTNLSRALAASADAASKELRERGFECPIDNQRFFDPVKTPCCGKTYCRQCIDDALADGDLVCPNCAKEDILMDDLLADDDMVKSLGAYDAEKAAEKDRAAKAVASTNETSSLSIATDTASPSVANDDTTASATAPATTAAAAADEVSDTDSNSSKKRKQPPTDIKPPTAPKAMRQAADPASKMEQDFIQQMEMLKNTPMGAMGMPMGMPMPMQMPQQMGFQHGYQNGYQMGFQPQQQMPQQQWCPQQNFGYGGQQQYGQQYGQQQQYGWGGQAQGQWGTGQGQAQGQAQGQQDPNDAYDRQPVNPRGRNRRSRAPDFRYL